MAEVLSQSEIDALLAALSSGEMDANELKKEESERKVKVYDFKRALRFSKDQIRGLTRIHENYARLLTTYFSAQLRTFVQITVASVDQLPYDEFIRSIPKMTILNIFEAPPLEGRMVLEVNPNIAYTMLDRLLGGQGTIPDKMGALTEIETTVMERVFSKALDTFHEAWKQIIELDPYMEGLEMNPQFMQIVSPNEIVAVISFSTKIGDTTGMINLCLPHVVLEPIMPKLSGQYWFSKQKKNRDEEERLRVEERVKTAKLPVIAELGTATITVGEFLQLQPGDVIQLDQLIENKLKIRVGNRLKFLGQPGTHKGRVAVQIEEVLEEGEENND
ncbi:MULTISPECIES: flagellar motor switch protein FliM [Bacillales]|jgi:flagellar motor switch protein FliM|uniref:Flagellar motor switch protein FliM n=1 Tax=Brevibacillus aydinogluensis TaxID=927786 RepID=A0AA48RE29_9BACL|nr:MULTISPECIES: flagellar motor switch protein FliM [Bacillales]REK64204.1 MAG: flagellar motor switch protein FliM [Brevibacillus sp.]MBR8659486.1 flagellar motor switch protein FliM [Brevibacillus sp. NL20B1]MDT3415016.1 flagellar motor switch protein FliM [Brevibacillus aydinogluensis]NNV01811.1 flagellar motor switch protein FliM [Brevibacillus sp. MCWH]UFJ60825.1 flagellar motor switch protein FliM [Anoxybacillus sediminis]